MTTTPEELAFVDVSGVGNSGKSAVVDLLREIEGIHVPPNWFEFDLLRVPGGLLDLRHAVVEDWSPVRSHAALQEFREVVRKMGRDPRWWDVPGLLDSTSQRYDSRFSGRFVRLANEFASSLVVSSYRAEWPYDLREHASRRAAKKVLRRIGFRRVSTREVTLVDGASFDRRVGQLLRALYATVVASNTDRVVLNNGLEPFNPTRGLDMIGRSWQVVVTRDPRDVYVSGLNAHNVSGEDSRLLAPENDGMNKSFLATDDLEVFVTRYRLYHEHVYTGGDPRVLHLRFEDLARGYDRSVQLLLSFLEIAPSRHGHPRTRFDPARSLRNVGLWRHYSRADEIQFIQNRLREYLVD